jgi:hypothetical protein
MSPITKGDNPNFGRKVRIEIMKVVEPKELIKSPCKKSLDFDFATCSIDNPFAGNFLYKYQRILVIRAIKMPK